VKNIPEFLAVGSVSRWFFAFLIAMLASGVLCFVAKGATAVLIIKAIFAVFFVLSLVALTVRGRGT